MSRASEKVIVGLLLLCLMAFDADAEDVLLFTYFRDNGQHGVNLAMTANGIDFIALNDDKPIFKPPAWTGQNLTRDASIVYRDGLFRMVWTSQWKGNIFGYAESPDLVHWSEPNKFVRFRSHCHLRISRTIYGRRRFIGIRSNKTISYSSPAQRPASVTMTTTATTTETRFAV